MSHLFKILKITFFPNFSNAVEDIGNIITSSDRSCQTLQMFIYTLLF